jgi:hypothetical protein
MQRENRRNVRSSHVSPESMGSKRVGYSLEQLT